MKYIIEHDQILSMIYQIETVEQYLEAYAVLGHLDKVDMYEEYLDDKQYELVDKLIQRGHQ